MKIGVQIRFLGVPQLADPSSPQWGEWPPAPDRVFQALVATAAEIGKQMDVLTHLESAPSIQASSAVMARAPVRYVPDNYRRTKRYHQGAARYLPTVIPESPVVTYLWDLPDDAVDALRQIVEKITHIGRASSLVVATLINSDTVTPNWVPDEHGELLIRSPYPGRLNDLLNAYSNGLRSPTAHAVGYRDATTIYPSSGWKELMVLRPEQQLDVSKTVSWTDKMRRAVMSRAPNEIPALISGHGNHRHVAWTAIPDVDHKYASGGILGLGCWLPNDTNNQERGLLGSCLMRITELDGIKLQMDQAGLKGLQASTWSRASQTWATATPIALDRWPKRNKTAEFIVSDSLNTMGLPRPEVIECSNYSPLQGAANARQYPSRKGNRYITHAVIHWSKPIAGPLIIGADRYFGSGLCRPLAIRK